MDDDIGKLGKLERTLWVPPPGGLTKKSRVFFIALGIFLSAPSAYSLLSPSGNGSAIELGRCLIGLFFFLWGIGDGLGIGGAGAIMRLFSFVPILPVAAVVIPLSLYMEMGFLGCYLWRQ